VRKLVILFFLVLTNLSLVGQTPPYIHFRGGEDIPSSETYHVIQDRQGYIWIATANGVSRFDGYEFRNFSVKDGLPDNVIHELYEDYKGRIWFISLSGLLSYYYNGKIYPYKYNYLMQNIFTGGRGAVKLSFRVSKNDDVSISVTGRGAFSISATGKMEILYKKNLESIVLDFSDGSHNGIITSNSAKVLHGEAFFFSNNQYTYNTILPINYFIHCFAVSDNQNNVLFSVDFKLFSKTNRISMIETSSKPIIWMSVDRTGLVWISKYNGGLTCYKSLDISKPPLLKLFDGLSITSVMEDREGGYWFTTYANGVFYVSNIYNRTYFWRPEQVINGQIQTFCATKYGIWVGFNSRNLVLIHNSGIVQNVNTNFLFKNDIEINKLYWDSNRQKLWLLSNVNLYSSLGREFVRHSYSNRTLGIPQGIGARCAAIEDNEVWIGTKSGLIQYDGHKVSYDSNISGDFRGTVSSIAIENNGTKWMGCSDGLWKYEQGKYEWLGLTNPILRSRIGVVVFNPVDSSLWIGTDGGGIVVLNKGVTSVINQSAGLTSDMITSIIMSNDQVWVGTSYGINQISIVPDISGKYIVGSFDKSVGIVSNEIVGLQATDSTLIIGTREGLMIYPLVNPTKQARPCVYITGFAVNGEDTVVKGGATFSYLENHITINFAGLTFKTLRKTLFRYKLHKDDTGFSYTRIPAVTLPALSPGSYNFEVWAQNAYGQWSDQPAIVNFVINPPFWDTPWFMFLVSTLFIVIVSTIFAIRYRTLRNQTDLSRRLDGWKQQALLQQMNPHFIFNTLNSIQLFILQNDTLSSHRYLSKFAKLMRLTLDNSQNFTVRLADELETISLYLELEELRADGKFTFEIQPPEDRLLEARIPSLIIQPFVENAIWHGVLPKLTKGKIKLQFWQKGDNLICTIEDDGIGRKAAEKYAATRIHKSLGSKITVQRLQLLRSLHSQQLGIIYKDLEDEDGNPRGTLVELTIPIVSGKMQLD